MDLKELAVRFSDSEVTPHQSVLANRVEQVLADTTQYERRERASQGNGPSVELVLRTRPVNLTVELFVFQDSVQILANEAIDMIELVHPKYYSAWVETAVLTVRALVDHPLRIRVRKTLFKRWPTGAIFYKYENGDGWCGDGLAILGFGKTYTFADWYVPVTPT